MVLITGAITISTDAILEELNDATEYSIDKETDTIVVDKLDDELYIKDDVEVEGSINKLLTDLPERMKRITIL